MDEDKNRNLIFISLYQSLLSLSWGMVDPFVGAKHRPFRVVCKAPLRVNPEQAPAFMLGSRRVDFIVIRMIQTGLIAATIPLVISIFATEPKGGAIGFLNSSRFAGNAFGSMIATSILAISNLTNLYLSINGLTLLALFGFKFLSRSSFHPQ